MDKESLKKNQFWYLLGGFGLVWLILCICSMASGSTAAAENKKNAEAKTKTLKEWSSKTPKNAKFNEPWEEYRKVFASQKEKVWDQAWKTQETFYQWPKTTDFDFSTLMLYAADSKTLTLRQREAYKKVYPTQFKDLDKLVAPAIFNGSDMETTKGYGSPGRPSGSGAKDNSSGFATIMGPTMAGSSSSAGGKGGTGSVPPPSMPDMGRKGGSGGGSDGSYLTVLDNQDDPPTPEEIWLLQEDFWVKREMLNIIHDVQQTVGHFTKVESKSDEPKPEGVAPDAVMKRYTNGVWEFTFYIESPKGAPRPVLSTKSTIKNVGPSHSVLPLAAARGLKPLTFVFKQGPIVFTLPVSGEPLPWNQTFSLSQLKEEQRKPDNLDLLKDFELDQEFDWSNAPIRRVDALRCAKQSHRTAKSALQPNKIFKVDDAPGTTAATPPAGGTGPGANASGNIPASTTQTGLGAKDPLVPGAGDSTPYKLERARYIMTTDQARHLPVAMVLVVEPAHINDILIAIANSPLRIQTTQVAFHQVSIRGPGDPNEEKEKTNKQGFPTSGKPQPGQPSIGTAMDEDADANLVELTIYGIAVLYERPKKAEDTKSGTVPTKPGTPPGPGTPPKTEPGKK